MPAGLEAGEADVWVSTDALRATLDHVRGRPDVVVTFDDGNRSDVDVALPELLERGMRASFFVCAGRLQDERYLGAEDLRRLRAAGMVVGSHGERHVPWRGLGDSALDAELRGARRALEAALGELVVEAAAPFGAYDRRVLLRARRAGFTRFYTSDGGRALRDGWRRPRTTMTRHDDPAAVLWRAEHPTAARTATLLAKRTIKAIR